MRVRERALRLGGTQGDQGVSWAGAAVSLLKNEIVNLVTYTLCQLPELGQAQY